MTTFLSRVTYLLFDHELTDGQDSFVGEEQTLDREVRLETSDGSVRYVSWTSNPVQYCVGIQEQSWFLPGEVSEIDVTTRAPWRHLVGEAIELTWQDPKHQILEVRGKAASVYLSSREGKYWCADAITVSILPPELPSNKSLERARER